MPSDRTRLTYDAPQQYRAVVEQQGRAFLDADWNEGFQITSEEQHKEALDFVGPVGTSDNGYEIGFPAPGAGGLPFDLLIRPGTMYAGGLRVELPPRDEEILYTTQPDWLNPELPNSPGNELILLALTEQEISAVEDSALKDVALGGVDTAQRLRLVQRIMRQPTAGATCAEAMKLAQEQWAGMGLNFDFATMQLTPVAQLQVGFVDDGTPPDLCEPTAQGGYLGAENQLVRVQIIAPDATTGAERFVWGYDNATFLYRISVDADDPSVVYLHSRPVDEFHEPRVGQVVEILAPAFALSNGEWVAAPTGEIMTLAAAYNPDGQSLTLPSPVSLDYLASDGSTQTHPFLFLRVWQETTEFTPGTAQDLGTTGVRVTLTTPAGLPFVLGTHWNFAVRPSTPVEVYPTRYRSVPQPAEGPRRWVCPLAVIRWVQTTGQLLEDCREHFDNLVELTKRKSGGCGCCVTLGPDEVAGGAGLQAAIDKLVAAAAGAPVTVSLRPGLYTLREPLRFGPAHSQLTLEGCEHAVVLQPNRDGGNFMDGIIALAESQQVTLRRLIFQMARTRYFDHTDRLAGMEPDLLIQLVKQMGLDSDAFARYLEELTVAIGIRAAMCVGLRVEDCTFAYGPETALPLFQVGLFLSDVCSNLRVVNNYFGPPDLKEEEEPLENPPMSFCLLHTPTIVAKLDSNSDGGRIEGGALLPALDKLILTDNVFEGLGAAVLVQTDIGVAHVEDNRVRHNYAGLLWLGLNIFEIILNQRRFPWMFLANQVVRDPLIAVGLFLGRTYPLPSHFDAQPHLQQDGITFNLAQPIPQASGLPGILMTIILRAFLPFEMALVKGLPVTVRYDLILAENSVEATRQAISRDERRPLSSYAYLLWNDARNPGSIIFSANRGLNRTFDDTKPTCFVVFSGMCSITGGVLHNLADENPGPSLAAFPQTDLDGNKEAPLAVTGNVLRGQGPNLPPRSGIPAPMDNLDFFNAVLPN